MLGTFHLSSHLFLSAVEETLSEKLSNLPWMALLVRAKLWFTGSQARIDLALDIALGARRVRLALVRQVAQDGPVALLA